MSTAVHGKTSLSEMLLADGAAPGKSGDDERDKTNTIDFGATLMSLIDQVATGKAAATGEVDAPAAMPVASKHGAKPSTTFDLTNADPDDRFAGLAATKDVAAKSRESAAPAEVDPHSTTVHRDSFAALLSNHKSTGEADVALEQSKVAGDDLKATDSKDAPTRAPDDRPAVDLATQPGSTAIASQAAVAATIDAPVAVPDSALDFRKQPFASKGADDASNTPAASIAAAKNFAKVGNPAPIEAASDITVGATPHATDPAHPHTIPSGDGTSPALSLPKSMNSADPKNAQQTFGKLAADATTSSTTAITSQTQMEAVAESAPQDERIRTINKDTPSQPADASSVANDSTRTAAAQPVVRTAEVAAIRLNPDPSPRDPAHTVSITVQLASGQTAQASVRERAGAVDVKIVTPTPASAQRVSSEMDGMRQNLDTAGIKLGHSEVSYQQGDGSGRHDGEGYRPPGQNQAANGKEVFIMNEVVQ